MIEGTVKRERGDSTSFKNVDNSVQYKTEFRSYLIIQQAVWKESKAS